MTARTAVLPHERTPRGTGIRTLGIERLEPPGAPLGVDALATHPVPLTEPPEAYDAFQKKEEGDTFKVVFRP